MIVGTQPGTLTQRPSAPVARRERVSVYAALRFMRRERGFVTCSGRAEQGFSIIISVIYRAAPGKEGDMGKRLSVIFAVL